MKKLNKLKTAIMLYLFLIGSYSWAVPIGIVDSGVDLEHPWFENKAWTHLKETPEYPGDVHGWNFADQNNQIIDYSYLNSFSPDIDKFYDIQLKNINRTATEEEKSWVQEKKRDKEFIHRLSIFGNFVHGTHVSGIASRTAKDAKILAAKIIPTEVKAFSVNAFNETLNLSTLLININSGFIEDFLIKMSLAFLAEQQTKMLNEVGQYLMQTKMSIANCSFGVNMIQAEGALKALIKSLNYRELTDEELKSYSQYLIKQILKKGANFIQSSENTLFVVAAGNDGTNNDDLPVFPANLELQNMITVAATKDYDHLASFSNYGAKHVDIAAPGVGIRSAIPGKGTFILSGTSQAAPFVTHIAGKILDINPKLKPSEIKKILLETVDKKFFLEGKVSSGGIANEERALLAAKLSKESILKEAINLAKVQIANVHSVGTFIDHGSDGEPVALPSLIYLNTM
jgi:subtilisin family serine protease